MTMDFSDSIKQFALEARGKAPNIKNEETTKTALIQPFFKMLGYDVSDPLEFVSEYKATFGEKSDAWVDYAIFDGGQPVILIEAKHCGVSLDKHDAQLAKYFAATKTARFGILTNGIEYRFFADLKDKYLMDSKPFLEFDLRNLKESVIPHIKLFCKETFTVDDALEIALRLKYSNEIKGYFNRQLQNPSDDFTKYVLSHITYKGAKSQAAIDKFKPIIINALEPEVQIIPDPPPEYPENWPRKPTQLELEGFYFIKAILADYCDISKIFYYPTRTYLVVYFDKYWKWICRLRFEWGDAYKGIAFPDKPNTKLPMEKLDDIFGTYKDQIVAALKTRMES
jgi:hypothetical protein